VLEVHRIDEIIELLQAFALGEIELPLERVAAALRLLDWAIDDAPPWPDNGDEAPVFVDGRVVFPFSRKFSA
jgi:hypothetical protein